MRVSNSDIDRIYVNIATRTKEYKFNMPDNHFHQYYELYYCKYSTCSYFVNNRILELHSGDFLLVPPREMHYTKYNSATPCTRINIYFKYSDLVDNTFFTNEDFKKYFTTIEVFHVPNAYQNKINEHLQNMLAEDKIDDNYSAVNLRLYLKQLFFLCMRFCKFNQSTPAIINTLDEQILTALRYISDNYAETLSLESVASISGLSYTYFSKKFKLTTGMRFKEYLNIVRLKHAATELATTNISITEIAINCGFNDSNYFTDVFKKIYGLSPRKYRKNSYSEISS